MTTKTVVVHGGTGVQGSHIIGRLAAAGFDIRPLTSRSCDLTDVDSVARAYDSVDAVVVQLPLEFDPVAITYAETIIAAVAKAGVRRAVFNPGTLLPSAPIGIPYIDARVLIAERLPAAVDAASVIGPAGPYLENLLQPWLLRRVREQGELAYPLSGTAPMPWVTLEDIGDVIAVALGEHRPNPVSVVAGPQLITGHQIAAAVGAILGREVRWIHIGPAEFERLLTPALGAAAAASVAGTYEQAAASPPPPPPVEILKLGGTTVEQWAAQQDWTA